MEKYVRNPKTNRLIEVNGTLYQNLKASGIKFGKPVQSKPAFVPVLDKTVPKDVTRNKAFGVDREDVPWGEKKPNTTKERRQLYDKCGKDAFLLPDALKFPIANKVTKNDSSCSYNCRGLKGASSRAGEWKYKNVLKNSKKLTKELGCYKMKQMKKK
jgi:hypothetical protein